MNLRKIRFIHEAESFYFLKKGRRNPALKEVKKMKLLIFLLLILMGCSSVEIRTTEEIEEELKVKKIMEGNKKEFKKFMEIREAHNPKNTKYTEWEILNAKISNFYVQEWNLNDIYNYENIPGPLSNLEYFKDSSISNGFLFKNIKKNITYWVFLPNPSKRYIKKKILCFFPKKLKIKLFHKV